MVMSRKLLVAIICAIISQPRNGVWSVRGWEDSCEVPFRPTHLFSAPIDDVVLFIGTRCEINGSVGFSFDAFGCYFSASRSSSQKKVLMCKATLNYYSCFGFEKRMEHVVGGSEPHLGHLNSVLKTKIFRHTQIAVSLMTTRHPSRVSDRPFCLSLSLLEYWILYTTCGLTIEMYRLGSHTLYTVPLEDSTHWLALDLAKVDTLPLSFMHYEWTNRWVKLFWKVKQHPQEIRTGVSHLWSDWHVGSCQWPDLHRRSMSHWTHSIWLFSNCVRRSCKSKVKKAPNFHC